MIMIDVLLLLRFLNTINIFLYQFWSFFNRMLCLLASVKKLASFSIFFTINCRWKSSLLVSFVLLKTDLNYQSMGFFKLCLCCWLKYHDVAIGTDKTSCSIGQLSTSTVSDNSAALNMAIQVSTDPFHLIPTEIKRETHTWYLERFGLGVLRLGCNFSPSSCS